MNWFARQKQRHRCREQTYGHQGGKAGWGAGGMIWEIGIDIYTLICIKQITNKNLQKKIFFQSSCFPNFHVTLEKGVLSQYINLQMQLPISPILLYTEVPQTSMVLWKEILIQVMKRTIVKLNCQSKSTTNEVPFLLSIKRSFKPATFIHLTNTESSHSHVVYILISFLYI